MSKPLVEYTGVQRAQRTQRRKTFSIGTTRNLFRICLGIETQAGSTNLLCVLCGLCANYKSGEFFILFPDDLRGNAHGDLFRRLAFYRKANRRMYAI
jgi:hypothetical protein